MSDSRLHKQLQLRLRLQFYSSSTRFQQCISTQRSKCYTVHYCYYSSILQAQAYLCKPCKYNKYRTVQQVVVSSYNDTHNILSSHRWLLMNLLLSSTMKMEAECLRNINYLTHIKVAGSTTGCFYLRRRIPAPPYVHRHKKIVVFMSYITSSTMLLTLYAKWWNSSCLWYTWSVRELIVVKCYIPHC
jgi:hypothetical protein